MLVPSPQRGQRIYSLYWSAMSLVVLALDYMAGPIIQFPAAFVIPVSLAAWYNGWLWGLVLSVALPLVRLYFTTLVDTPWSFTEAAINAGIRIAVLGSFAVLIDRVAVQSAALRERVDVLEGILPVCLVCKRIRDEGATWRPLEEYTLSQGAKEGTAEVCPDCTSKLTQTYDRR